MRGALILAGAALALGFAALVQLLPERGRPGDASLGSDPARGLVQSLAAWPALAAADARLGLSARIARAGLAARISAASLIAAKAGAAFAGALWALVVAPAAPDRLAWLVAIALPVTAFLAPDAWLEQRARRRLRALRAGLPDALDLLAVGAAAGRSPLAELVELGAEEGSLARELAVLSAETSCGMAEREALASLRSRAPVSEVAAMCGVIERSRRYGSPLADQFHDQATAIRGAQRRRIAEQAARAAPKMQLAVALLLVPSVLLMIAAGLIANVDRFMAGF